MYVENTKCIVIRELGELLVAESMGCSAGTQVSEPRRADWTTSFDGGKDHLLVDADWTSFR